jgi:hypothetical protein
LLLAVVAALCALGVFAPSASSVEYFRAATTQSPPNPVPQGQIVTYTTTVTNVYGEPYPFSWMLPGEDPEAVVNLFVLRSGSHRGPPSTYLSVTPSQGTCTRDDTTPPSWICTLGSIPAGGTVTYVTTIEALVSMDNRVAVLRLGPDIPADISTVVTPACVVPNVVGRLLASARKLLAKASCGVGSVTRKRASRRKRGRVIRQSPAAGAQLANAAPVALVVGRR